MKLIKLTPFRAIMFNLILMSIFTGFWVFFFVLFGMGILFSAVVGAVVR